MTFQLLSGNKVYLTKILHYIKDLGIPVRVFKTSKVGDGVTYLIPNFWVSHLGIEIFLQSNLWSGKIIIIIIIRKN